MIWNFKSIFYYNIISQLRTTSVHRVTNNIDTAIITFYSSKRFLIRKSSGQPILSQWCAANLTPGITYANNPRGFVRDINENM